MSSVNTNDSLVVDEEAERKQREEKQARLEKVRKKQEEIKRKADEKRSLIGEDEDDDTTATSTQAAPAPLREDVIASSVAFLNHPKVKPSPLAKKVCTHFCCFCYVCFVDGVPSKEGTYTSRNPRSSQKSRSRSALHTTAPPLHTTAYSLESNLRLQEPLPR